MYVYSMNGLGKVFADSASNRRNKLNKNNRSADWSKKNCLRNLKDLLHAIQLQQTQQKQLR